MAFEMLSFAADVGCNFIDTANRYGHLGSHYGASEEIIGRWLRSRDRARFIIATKVRAQVGDGPNESGLSRKHILHQIDQSLRRLQTDYIDLYQTHWPDEATPLEETLDVLNGLVRQGKVRYLGCSNYPAWLMCKSLWVSDKHGWARFESVQPEYSLAHRSEFERELQALCLDQGIGVIGFSPLASGFLTGKYKQDANAPDGSRGEILSDYMERYFTPENFRIVTGLGELASAHGMTPAQLALAWVLANPAVSASIVGARNLDQLRPLSEPAMHGLAPELKEQLDALSAWPDDRTPL
jgi:aryl-alcohol dehydrogenase-like predicted oxidoreductase